MPVELLTVPSLDVLGLAELHQHLGGGVDHVHLVKDSGAVVRNRHLAFGILTVKNNVLTKETFLSCDETSVSDPDFLKFKIGFRLLDEIRCSFLHN
jgi:hypothetical protein